MRGNKKHVNVSGAGSICDEWFVDDKGCTNKNKSSTQICQNEPKLTKAYSIFPQAHTSSTEIKVVFAGHVETAFFGFLPRPYRQKETGAGLDRKAWVVAPPPTQEVGLTPPPPAHHSTAQ